MPEVQNTTYLSIGEVLGLLLAEFPDITISKIRFLESQGLIAPERTPSGYRKFYEPDVELLKVILREQRENYLPLRVIKDRIDSGAIDPSGEMTKPDGLPDVHVGPPNDAIQNDVQNDSVHEAPHDSVHDAPHDTHGDADDADDHGADEHETEPEADVPAATIAAHPASSRSLSSPPPGGSPPTRERRCRVGACRERPCRPHAGVAAAAPGGAPRGFRAVRDDEHHGAELNELRSYGIVTGRDSGGTMLYGDDAVEIAKVAAEFLRLGVDARHLRGWRTAVEREASLFEQLITPRLRQRNPESRTEALNQLRQLDALGAKLRAALMRTALRHHFEG